VVVLILGAHVDDMLMCAYVFVFLLHKGRICFLKELQIGSSLQSSYDLFCIG